MINYSKEGISAGNNTISYDEISDFKFEEGQCFFNYKERLVKSECDEKSAKEISKYIKKANKKKEPMTSEQKKKIYIAIGVVVLIIAGFLAFNTLKYKSVPIEDIQKIVYVDDKGKDLVGDTIKIEGKLTILNTSFISVNNENSQYIGVHAMFYDEDECKSVTRKCAIGDDVVVRGEIASADKETGVTMTLDSIRSK